jgi:prevent-host-death family protein
MKTVNARQANHEFSDLLSRVERGAEILITKRNEPVAVLSPYRLPLMTPEREKAVQHAIDVMGQGLPWGGTAKNQARRNAQAVMISTPAFSRWRRYRSDRFRRQRATAPALTVRPAPLTAATIACPMMGP